MIWRVQERFLATLIGFLLILSSGCGAAAHKHDPHHRGPADIQEYLAHLDRPERDAYQKPDQVVQALALQPGMAVADLGSGSGYFTRRFAKAVGQTGTVYAIDVEQEMLDYAQASLARMDGVARTEFILTEPNSTGLPADSVDLIFVCNVYHHLEDQPVYFQKATSALRRSGRIVIIDFYADHRSGDVGFPRRHLVARKTVVDDMTQAGFMLVSEHTFLERQYFLEFALARP